MSRYVCAHNTDVSGKTQILKASDFASCMSESPQAFPCVAQYSREKGGREQQLVPHIEGGLVFYFVFFSLLSEYK